MNAAAERTDRAAASLCEAEEALGAAREEAESAAAEHRRAEEALDS